MYVANISLPTEQEDGSIKLVRKDHKIGRHADHKTAFAFAQSCYNKWGGKVHSVVCITPPEKEGKKEDYANA